MAVTQNTYTGNGSTTNYSFTFPYLETTDIKVSVNGVNTTAYTLANATTVSFNTAPANGAAIRIYRDTDDSALAATFYPGSAIRANDLNYNFNQNLYVTQEVNNNAVQIDGSNAFVADLDMGGYKITNLADPVAGDDAATRSFVEQSLSSEFPIFYRRWSKTATGGETSLSGNDDAGISLSYVPGSEKVFINGALQVRGTDYVGATGTTLTGIPALTAGDIVEVHSSSNYTIATVPDGSVTNAKVDAAAAIQASKLAFAQSGTGAITRTVESKLRDVVSVKDFGAVGDGVTDDTAALQAAFSYAISEGCTLVLDGDYLVSAAIIPIASFTGTRNLSVRVDRASTITFNASAPYIRYLFYFVTDGINNFSLTGCPLTVELNNKVATAFWIRHQSASDGGQVVIDLPLYIKNARDNSSDTDGTHGVWVQGSYVSCLIKNVTVSGLSRVAASGWCQGIVVYAMNGTTSIENCTVSSVSYPAGGFDADGVYISGVPGANQAEGFLKRPGTFYIRDCVFIDCAGRAIKIQATDATVLNPTIRRQALVGFSNSTDIDFQIGGGTVINPVFEYRLNSGVSPLGSSHACIAFQNRCIDADTIARASNVSILTEARISRIILITTTSNSLNASTTLDGLTARQIGSLTTEIVERSIIEHANMELNATKTKETYIGCFNISGPFGGTALVGYTGYTSGSLSTKLTVDINNCHNNLVTGTTMRRMFEALSGSYINQVKTFRFGVVSNYSKQLRSGWVFNYRSLTPGTSFIYDIANTTATNAPPSLGSTGFAFVECLGEWVDTTSKILRVTKENADAANTVFYSYTGSTWGTIK